MIKQNENLVIKPGDIIWAQVKIAKVMESEKNKTYLVTCIENPTIFNSMEIDINYTWKEVPQIYRVPIEDKIYGTGDENEQTTLSG